MSARERILARIRDTLEERPKIPHPGMFHGGRPTPAPPPLDAFSDLFTRAGGEVVRVPDLDAARAWILDFARDFAGVAVGATVPEALRPDAPPTPPEAATLGLSVAWGAVAETGSLVLSSVDGRRTQLFPPTHVVVVPPGSVHATLAGALTAIRSALPSALGLHSGPSKSADIGQILVRGVHGPGRVIALMVDR